MHLPYTYYMLTMYAISWQRSATAPETMVAAAAAKVTGSCSMVGSELGWVKAVALGGLACVWFYGWVVAGGWEVRGGEEGVRRGVVARIGRRK